MVAPSRLLAPVAAPPPPKPPQLNLIASALMPDVSTDVFGPGAAPALTAAGWEPRRDGHGDRVWDRPPGDRYYRQVVEARNAMVVALDDMDEDDYKAWWGRQQRALTAAVGVMSDMDLQQAEARAGVTWDTLPASVFPASKSTRWTGGFEYAPENQAPGVISDPCGTQVEDLPGTGSGTYTNLPLVGYVPFLIQVEDSCSTWGWSERDFTGRALRLLDNATPNAVEREFWTGAFARNTNTGPIVGTNAFLQQSNNPANGGTGLAAVDLTPGTVPSVTRGIQILEDYLANTGFGGQGMLHVAPETSPNLLGARRVGSLLLSVMDNIIVPGSGYPTSGATGPAGASNATPPSGQQWIFATDLVSVRLDLPNVFPSVFAEAVERGNLIATTPNLVRIRAQRFAAVSFDLNRLAACRVTLAT